MSIVTGLELGSTLVKVLGLPSQTKEFSLHCAVDEPVTIECSYFLEAEREGLQELETHFRTYELRERTAADTAPVTVPDADGTAAPPADWRDLINYRVEQALEDIDHQASNALTIIKLRADLGLFREY